MGDIPGVKRQCTCPHCKCEHLEVEPQDGQGGQPGEPPPGVDIHPTGEPKGGEQGEPGQPGNGKAKRDDTGGSGQQGHEKNINELTKDIDALEQRLKGVKEKLAAGSDELKAAAEEARKGGSLASNERFRGALKGTAKANAERAEIEKAMAEKSQALAGEVAGGLSLDGWRLDFGAIDKADLQVIEPEPLTIDTLIEYLVDYTAEERKADSGSLDPKRFPQYYDEENLYRQDSQVKQRKVRFLVYADCSGSMGDTMEDGLAKHDNAINAISILCEAAEEIEATRGVPVDTMVVAWGSPGGSGQPGVGVIKDFDDMYDKNRIAAGYMKEFGKGQGTDLSNAINHLYTVQAEVDARDVLVIISDGCVSQDGKDRLSEARTDGRAWIVLGIDAVDEMFHHSAHSGKELNTTVVGATMNALDELA